MRRTKQAVALFGALAIAGAVGAAEPAAEATVTVYPEQELGAVKPMHAVNNGPSVSKPGGDQKCGNFEDYRAARLPFARTHDSIGCVSGGPHACDISVIFPDFDADENDPKNYDFVFTDHYLDTIRRAGAQVFFRLGQTIEHGPKKYGVMPPKDYAKWARICEHVIRHYNEGWAWGLDNEPTTRNVAWSNQFNIVYWEIWNEPDLDFINDRWKTNPRTWGGSAEEFFRFYGIAAKHLKAKFPALKIGGPAVCWNPTWSDMFLGYCETNSVPLDFFSWHTYARTTKPFAEAVVRFRGLLDRHGFTKAESILNEWNYIKGWSDDFVYSLRVESGDLNLKGAAFTAAVMSTCQAGPLDMLMYYDARLSTSMNGMFAKPTYWPLKGYYPFYAWGKLVDRGTQVKGVVSDGCGEDTDANTGFVEKKDKTSSGQFYVTAAKGADGSGAILVTRYSDDDNVSDTAKVIVRVPGKSLAGARCHLTDIVRTYTEVPLAVQSDGSVQLFMQPLSFALIEY